MSSRMGATTDRHYLCSLCGDKRSKRSLMVAHMQKNHPENVNGFTVAGEDRRRYLCTVCGCYLSKLSVLRSHMQRHESVQRLSSNNTCQSASSLTAEEEFHSCSTSSSVLLCPNSSLEACASTSQGPRLSSPTSSSKDTEAASTSKSSFSEEVLTYSHPESRKRNRCFVCSECGYAMKKASHLQQHLLTHSDERPHKCPKDGCKKSYKRRDHLDRHVLSHESPGFLCTWHGCIAVCSNHSNLVRHLRRHELKGFLQRGTVTSEKSFRCPEPGCEKTFRFPSMVEHHCASAHGLQHSEILCGEPGCGERFQRVSALYDHIRVSHPTLECSQCGASVLRKCFSRHLMAHDDNQVKQRLFCPFDGCQCSYSSCSNLKVHIRAHHMGKKEFHCTFEDCGKTFAYRHTRDKHEKTGRHFHTEGDFTENDKEFQSRPQGGRKPVMLESVEDLYRRRVFGPEQDKDVHI